LVPVVALVFIETPRRGLVVLTEAGCDASLQDRFRRRRDQEGPAAQMGGRVAG
jgi:hypothetical protein